MKCKTGVIGNLPNSIMPIGNTPLAVSKHVICNNGFIGNKTPVGGIPAFRVQIKTTAPGETFTDPLEVAGTYDYIRNNGDGTKDHITAYNQAEVTHAYAVAGTYIRSYTGTLYGWRFNSTGDKDLIYDVLDWGFGVFRLGNSEGYFFGCTNFTSSAKGPIDLTGTTTLRRAWQGSSFLNNIDFLIASDTSLITSINGLLIFTTSLDQSLGGMNIASVIDMTNLWGSGGIGTTSYSSSLVGFNAQPHQDNVPLTNVGATYNLAGAVARIDLIADGWTIQDLGPQSLGADLLAGWDFTSGWTASAATIDDADSFTTLVGFGFIFINGSLLEVGKTYQMTIEGVTVSSSIIIGNVSGSVRYYNGNIAPSVSFDFIAVDTRFLIQNTSASTTDITTMTVKEIL